MAFRDMDFMRVNRSRARLCGGGPQVEEPPLDVAALGQEALQLAVDGALAAQRLVQQPIDVVQAGQLRHRCCLCIGGACTQQQQSRGGATIPADKHLSWRTSSRM